MFDFYIRRVSQEASLALVSFFGSLQKWGTRPAGTLCMICDADLYNHQDKFFEAIAEVQPTVFFAPPPIYERIYHKLRSTKRQMSGIQRVLLDWSSGTLKEKHLNNANRIAAARKLNQWQTSVAKNTVCKKYKELLGFSKRTVFLSRGGPMSAEVLRFLAGYDLVIHESFGHSENCGLLTANIPKRYCKLGTAGKPVPGVKIKISPSNIATPFTDGNNYETGEICGWGRNIFMGYLNKENETKEIINSEDNWLKLGDLGYIDSEGYTAVLGKANDFITLKSEEVISPFRIEQLVRLELPCVKQVMVIGDRQDYLAALLTIDTITDEKSGLPSNILTDEAQKWFRNARFDVRQVSDIMDNLDHGLHHVIQAGIDRANQGVRTTSHMLADWRIINNQFTYQAGELGLNGKLKRSSIIENHSNCIKAMYINEEEPGFCSSGGSEVISNNSDSVLHPHLLTQIKEEDETKSSRNTIDKVVNDISTTKISEAISVTSLSSPINVNEDHKTTIVVVSSEPNLYVPKDLDEEMSTTDDSAESSRKTSSSSTSKEINSPVTGSIMDGVDHEKISRK